MIIRSRVPLRISFSGGGTDVSPYCDEYGGMVLNATIDRYATITLIPKNDKNMVIKSVDYDLTVKYDVDENLAYDGQLDLIKGVINHFKGKNEIPSGFEIYIHNDAPPGSGLGSSSAVCVALIGAFKEWLNLPLTPYDIAELAFKIERIELGIKGGRQDQYATAFGGFNFMEFYDNRTIVNPLKLSENIINELHYSLILAYIGGSHDSSKILSRQIKNVKTKNKESLQSLHNLKELAINMKNALVMGKLGKFGLYLDEAWNYKKKMAEGITNEKIDNIYLEVKNAGALGGKISGAGGGGFMFFFTELDRRYDVIKKLKELGAQVINYSFEDKGLRTWKVEK
ncbi:GHMP family kinase ATP-binding protein [Thermosipho atlanticus]|uniref:D-glycero-alpha-D-manno-heptose-7-phosphate kinase n=1 Tax=Thermosipho atlanticus DSM 15807 TaxID=1123380 RepID=A0A1M5RKX5_9BACT|nr:GHMP kinase [Thermosipho atlanticus]SHH26850.1 D-glycero-alpha-D-manno-heptose-7-phosphate kinase [Thermosipho atlanticus DSM 15807]